MKEIFDYSLGSKIMAGIIGLPLLAVGIVGFFFLKSIVIFLTAVCLTLMGLFLLMSCFQRLAIIDQQLIYPYGPFKYKIPIKNILSLNNSKYPFSIKLSFNNRKGNIISLDIGKPQNVVPFANSLNSINKEILISI